jgi:cellulose synthase/poly-beta-1,6-N-acetylglucosamine synthase-like glycosyltransferase
VSVVGLPSLIEFLFWAAVSLALYAYALFPLLLFVRSRLARRPYLTADHVPSVSLIVCAHNEAGGISEKLENIRQLDYPPERMEVIVASDGSSDGTNEQVRAHADRVRLLALPRRGKIQTLNAAVLQARGEILVFSDANSIYAPDAVRALVRPFASPEIGGVAGDQRYVKAAKGADGGDGERAYWDLDRKLKQWQSVAGSVTSATGAIHAIRRELYRPVPAGVTDDFWVSTSVVAQGRRLVFAGEAAAFEPAARTSDLEFRRKVRVMTRGFRGVWLRRSLLNPFHHGFYSLQLLSHKLLRRLVFLPLGILLVTSPLLWNHGHFYQVATVGQVAFYGLAAAGAWLRPSGRARLLALPFYFCMVNAASLLAALNVLRGKRIDLWEPQRDPTLPAPGARADTAGKLPLV